MSSQLILATKKSLATRNVDMSGANSIFGTLGGGAFPILSRMNFIPTDNNGSTLSLTGEGDSMNPRWIGLDSVIMKFWAYIYCSPLASVIDRLAEADTNGIVQFVDEDTMVPIKNINKIPKLARIRKLFKKPNPWQTWEEFDGEQTVLCKIFGYCPVFAIGSSSLDRSFTKAFVNLNPVICTPIANDSFDIFKEESQIKHWVLSIRGKTYEIPSKDILLIKDGFISKGDSEMGLPVSKVHGMDFFVSNILAAMEANNVILKKKGPLGVFSYDAPKDIAGYIPATPEHKDSLQEDLARYGLTMGQLQYVISKMPIKWNAMSFNLRDLMTKEIIRDGIDGICDRFGYPAELMSGKNATYENRSSSEKFLYQNNIIPYSLRKMTRYTQFFDLDGVLIQKSYKHLPVLQEDIVKAGEAYRAENDGLQVEWESGMITWNQWQMKKERDAVPGMDIYYPDYIKKYPLMNKNKQLPAATKPKDGKDTSSKDTGAKK